VLAGKGLNVLLTGLYNFRLCIAFIHQAALSCSVRSVLGNLVTPTIMATPTYPRYKTLFDCGMERVSPGKAQRGLKRQLKRMKVEREAAEAARAAKDASMGLEEARVKRRHGRPRKIPAVDEVLAPSSKASAGAAGAGNKRPLLCPRKALGTASAGPTRKRLGVAPAVLPEGHPVAFDGDSGDDDLNDEEMPELSADSKDEDDGWAEDLEENQESEGLEGDGDEDGDEKEEAAAEPAKKKRRAYINWFTSKLWHPIETTLRQPRFKTGETVKLLKIR
jgi:hypothetical protein